LGLKSRSVMVSPFFGTKNQSSVAAGQSVAGGIIMDRCRVQPILPVWTDAGLDGAEAHVVTVAGCPLGHDGIEGGQPEFMPDSAVAELRVVIGVAADQDVVAEAAVKQVGAQAADQDVAAGAAVQPASGHN